ncbi:MAG: stage II sporulation protein R [Firmicutes bacterium]|nr:stage II sporulation protein R [Bacillota bacterium]
MKKYIKHIISGLVIVIALFTISYNYYMQQQYAEELVRFHVIANSNTIEDQTLKLRVRDAVVSEMKERFASVSTKEEALVVTEKSLNEVKEIAKEQIAMAGKDYDVQLTLGDYRFPTKTYGDITLPAGQYQALRVVIGEGSGRNWWCVLFPPLCFVDGVQTVEEGQQKGVKVFEKDDVEYRIRALEMFK